MSRAEALRSGSMEIIGLENEQSKLDRTITNKKLKAVRDDIIKNMQRLVKDHAADSKKTDLNAFITPPRHLEKTAPSKFKKIQAQAFKAAERAINKMATTPVDLGDMLNAKADKKSAGMVSKIRQKMLKQIEAQADSTTSALKVEGALGAEHLFGDAANDDKTTKKINNVRRKVISNIAKSVGQADLTFDGELKISDLMGETPADTRRVRRAYENMRIEAIKSIAKGLVTYDGKAVEIKPDEKKTEEESKQTELLDQIHKQLKKDAAAVKKNSKNDFQQYKSKIGRAHV